MRPVERLALAIILGLTVLVGGSAAAGAYAWHQAGQVRLAVHEYQDDGLDLQLTLPGALVNAAIALCPVPHDLAVDARFRGMLPALRDVADQLAAMPDAVLVDIDDRGETVRIAKVGRALLIRIHSREQHLELQLPIESVKQLVSKLEAQAKA